MRTSFHHQPEAQHPKFFSYPQAAGHYPIYGVESGHHRLVMSISAFDPERPCGLGPACRVLPPALLHRLIVLAGARTYLGVPIALEKVAKAAVAPIVALKRGHRS